ncbi:hypothetical protein BDQ17DRAFT_1374689 [Cyathus striatus]|nr:hypothetical protein BDQ17DRAFT_1374689 [Cyathus striatus]
MFCDESQSLIFYTVTSTALHSFTMNIITLLSFLTVSLDLSSVTRVIPTSQHEGRDLYAAELQERDLLFAEDLQTRSLRGEDLLEYREHNDGFNFRSCQYAGLENRDYDTDPEGRGRFDLKWIPKLKGPRERYRPEPVGGVRIFKECEKY